MFIEIDNENEYKGFLKFIKDHKTITEGSREVIRKAVSTGFKIAKLYGSDVKLEGSYFENLQDGSTYEMSYFAYIELDK